MRTLTAAALSKFADREGVEPIIAVELTWPTYGVATYGVRSVPSLAIQGRLGSISDIRSVVGSNLRSTTTTVSVKLLDADKYFHARMRVDQIEQVPARVMLYEGSLTSSDAVELYAGRVGSPVTWDTDTRHLNFDIVSGVKSDEIAFTPESSDINEDIHEDADGKPWPIILGTARDVPCPLVVRGPRTELAHDIDSSDTSFEVDDADDFTSGTIQIVVDGELMSGSFSGDTFTATARNQRFYLLSTTSRSGVDFGNPFVLWINGGASKQLAGKYAIIENVPGGPSGGADPTRVNFCVAQKGDKCFFEKPWTKDGDDFWTVPSGYDVKWRRYAWQVLDDSSQFGDNAGAWTTKAGATITEWGNDTDKYVVSSQPVDSTSDVLRVAAFRQHKENYAGIERRKLIPIPPSYYEITASNASFTPNIGDPDPTTLKFNPALDLRSQGWDTDTIYVSAEGSVGANTVDQIEWIIENGTNLTVDATSFATARAKVTKYRTDCAILGGGDALEVASDLAFQARCALIVAGNTVKIRYISEEPTAYEATFDSTTIRQDSFTEEHSDTDDVWTEVIGRWEKWYSHDDQGKPPKEVKRTVNTDVFGKHSETIVFWGYQRKNNVIKSTEFWLGRKGRIWRMVRCQVFLKDGLRLEPWDRVRVNLTDFGSATIGWLMEWIYNPKDHVIEALVWMPIESGASALSDYAYADDSGDSTNPNPRSKIKAGQTEYASITPLPFSLASEAMQDGSRVFFEITKYIGSSAAGSYGGTNYIMNTFVVDIYPRGFAHGASGSAHMKHFDTQSASSTWVGIRGGCARAPGGFYISIGF